MSLSLIRIATRQSPLALWQAEHVAARLRSLHPDLTVELLTFTTRGDKILDSPLAKIGGKALFVKELEQALLEEAADIAVHSCKDVPVDLPAGLELPVILPREDPRDALVANAWSTLAELPDAARVGTSSLRRQCQLLHLRPDLRIADLRGNVGTRLGKLDSGEFDAIILACAGLRRMGEANRITEALAPETLLPAIAQGAIGIECRSGDAPVLERIMPLHDPDTGVRVAAERALNRGLMGGCQVPIAGYAELAHGVILLRGLVGSLDGRQRVLGDISGRPEDAVELGGVLAEDLLARGAAELLREFHQPADGNPVS